MTAPFHIEYSPAELRRMADENITLVITSNPTQVAHVFSTPDELDDEARRALTEVANSLDELAAGFIAKKRTVSVSKPLEA